MKKKILPLVLCLSLILPLAGCGKGVTQEDYNKLAGELAEVKAKVASLEKELGSAQGKYLEMAVYTAFLDLLMYPIFVAQDIPTRFDFENVGAWQDKLRDGAKVLKDEKLIEYADKVAKNEIGVAQVIEYIIERILDKASS